MALLLFAVKEFWVLLDNNAAVATVTLLREARCVHVL
jgi:hypothetical protein